MDENELARRAAIYESPVGRSAAQVYEAVRELYAAIEEFLTAYPDDEAVQAATLGALAGAGLTDPRRASRHSLAAYCGDCFAGTPDELRGWRFQVELMLSLLEDMAPPGEAVPLVAQGA
jgi:hypothetical protein